MSVGGNAASAPLVRFEDVTFGYGPTPAVEHVSFSVERGDFVALIGPNGSGKTTLLKLALGLLEPRHGRVLLFGQDVRGFREWMRVGYVPQTATAFQVRFPATVGEIVAHGLYRAVDPLAIFRRGLPPQVWEALETVGMWDLRDRLVGDLSVGQQQRVLIARALARHPELLMLDEPTAGVDMAGQERFYELLRHFREQQAVTIVLISHDVGVVLHEANKVACMNRRLMYFGAAEEVSDQRLTDLYGFRTDLVLHRHE